MKCYCVKIVSKDGIHTRYFTIKSHAYERFVALVEQYNADVIMLNDTVGTKTYIAEAIAENLIINLLKYNL